MKTIKAIIPCLCECRDLQVAVSNFLEITLCCSRTSSLVLLRRLLLLEQISGGGLVVEIFCLVYDHVGGREALRVDGVVGLEPEQQGLVDGDDFRWDLKRTSQCYKTFITSSLRQI